MKKTISILLAAIITLGMPINTAAATAPSTKEEVVYVNLNSDGRPRETYIVNSFLNSDGNLLDYGNYDFIRNLSTTEQLNFKDGTITGDISGAEFYYEGELIEAQIPWNIEVIYTLNGETIAAKDIVGKSGKIEIQLIIGRNKKANSKFYENYALQTSVSLDSKIFKNITAKDANVLNAGENKNVTFMLLPNNSANYTITADAESFELAPISLNGVPFAMNINIDGKDSFADAFEPLTDAIDSLDKGAVELQSGAKKLQGGIHKLSQESNTVVNGSKEILSAIEQINKAIVQLKQINNGTDKVIDASKSFKTGLGKLSSTLSEITKDSNEVKQFLNLMSQNPDPNVQKLVMLYNTKMSAVNQSAQAAALLNENYDSIHSGISELNNSMKSLSTLTEGVNALLLNYRQLHSGIQSYTNAFGDIVKGYASVYQGINEITNAAEKLHEETKDMDKDIQDKIDSAFNDFQNKDFAPISFVSDKNTNVNLVQFVMKTDSINIPTPQAEQRIEEKQSFWDKLSELFKL